MAGRIGHARGAVKGLRLQGVYNACRHPGPDRGTRDLFYGGKR